MYIDLANSVHLDREILQLARVHINGISTSHNIPDTIMASISGQVTTGIVRARPRVRGAVNENRYQNEPTAWR